MYFQIGTEMRLNSAGRMAGRDGSPDEAVPNRAVETVPFGKCVICNEASIGAKLAQGRRSAPTMQSVREDAMTYLTRRTVVQATAGMAAAALAPRIVLAQTTPPPAGPFRQDPLPYPTNALEPSIDARTMEIHHDR